MLNLTCWNAILDLSIHRFMPHRIHYVSEKSMCSIGIALTLRHGERISPIEHKIISLSNKHRPDMREF